jgi:hypothetical protein
LNKAVLAIGHGSRAWLGQTASRMLAALVLGWREALLGAAAA